MTYLYPILNQFTTVYFFHNCNTHYSIGIEPPKLVRINLKFFKIKLLEPVISGPRHPSAQPYFFEVRSFETRRQDQSKTSQIYI